MDKRFNLGVAVVTLLTGALFAALPPVSTLPVEVGQWHSNLAAATAKAQELHVPMLVVWGDPGCAFCKDFDNTVLLDAAGICENYLSNRGIILVFETSASGAGTDIRNWVGRGDWPLLRVTWWREGMSKIDSGVSNWERPNTSRRNFTGSFNNFTNTLERYISAYKAGSLDQSKDAFDPANDSAAGAAVLSWRDQSKTETLKLAKKTTAEAYTDLADWFTLPVETGKTYQVSFAGVSGITTDAPQVALYSDEGSTVVGSQTALANGVNYEFVPTTQTALYIKVWRTASVDTNIVYSMTYQRIAPGSIEFAATTAGAPESAANVKLTVKRVGGTTGTATVTIGTEDRTTLDAGYTATAGEDFTATPVPATLTWADGDSADKIVTIPLIKTVAEWEAFSESFGVTLNSSTDNAVGADAVVTLTEVDLLTTRVASYDGWVGTGADKGRLAGIRVLGTMTLSVGSGGRISGKAVFPRSAPGFAGNYMIRDAAHRNISNGIATITGNLVQSRTYVPFSVELDTETGAMMGTMTLGGNTGYIEMARDEWSSAEGQQILAALNGSYTVAFPVVDTMWPTNDAPNGSGYASIKVDTRGRFRASGKLGDGTTFIQSGVLMKRANYDKTAMPKVSAVLYAAPSSYKGGAFTGVIDFGDDDGDGVLDVVSDYETDLYWINLNPQAVATYDAVKPGFGALLAVDGGRYNASQDLNAFFADKVLSVGELDSPLDTSVYVTIRTTNETGRVVTTRLTFPMQATAWQTAGGLSLGINAAGTGFTVPGGDLALTGATSEFGAPVYNYDTALNPCNLRLTLNRNTGVISGSFRAYYDYPTVWDLTTETAQYFSWRHTAKTISFQSILLLAHAYGDSAASEGYYLVSGRASYRPATGNDRPYMFKQSADFRINASSLAR